MIRQVAPGSDQKEPGFFIDVQPFWNEATNHTIFFFGLDFNTGNCVH